LPSNALLCERRKGGDMIAIKKNERKLKWMGIAGEFKGGFFGTGEGRT
jgi:hypothetical protein